MKAFLDSEEHRFLIVICVGGHSDISESKPTSGIELKSCKILRIFRVKSYCVFFQLN